MFEEVFDRGVMVGGVLTGDVLLREVMTYYIMWKACSSRYLTGGVLGGSMYRELC